MTHQESSHDFYEAKMAEGLKIDPRTAYVMKSYAQVLDPYGIEHDLPGELQCIGSVYFARAPGSDDWVEFRHLPAETCAALEDRIATGKPAETVPFDGRVECIADAIGAVYDPYMDNRANDRARALEAAQAALDALEQWDATVASKRSDEPSEDLAP